MFGGWQGEGDSSQLLNDVWTFDVQTSLWKQLDAGNNADSSNSILPGPRGWSQREWTDDTETKLMLYGGEATLNGASYPFNTAFDAGEGVWYYEAVDAAATVWKWVKGPQAPYICAQNLTTVCSDSVTLGSAALFDATFGQLLRDITGVASDDLRPSQVAAQLISLQTLANATMQQALNSWTASNTTDNNATCSLQCLQSVRDTNSSVLFPPPIEGHFMQRRGSNIYMFGGEGSWSSGIETGGLTNFFNDVWIFDVLTEQWTVLSQPQPITGVSTYATPLAEQQAGLWPHARDYGVVQMDQRGYLYVGGGAYLDNAGMTAYYAIVDRYR